MMLKYIPCGLVIIDSMFNVLKTNGEVLKLFAGFLDIKEGDNIVEYLKITNLVHLEEMVNSVNYAVESRCTTSVDFNLNTGPFSGNFKVEVIPVFGPNHICTLIKFEKNEAIIENEESLIDMERLVNLGKMVGGIAHNLKSPIMAISGAMNGLKELANEYKNSIGDSRITDYDHSEIADEMFNWIEKMGPYLSYMSEIISAVKGQAVITDETDIWIGLEELVKKIEILMGHEFKYNHCNFNVNFQTDRSTKIKVKISLLLQVINNLIGNAIDAYEGKQGLIEMIIDQEGDFLEFTIKDNGKGMSEELKKRIFKETITTKGEKGTGLGLYNSYLIIKKHFNGELWFDSQEGKGTDFHIRIPSNIKVRGDKIAT